MDNPRPYDLTKQAEVNRLIRELRGYMQVSIRDGTDTEGRQHALSALNTILDNGWEVMIDDEPFEPPTVNNEVI